MKSHIICVLLIFLLSISITGCSSRKNNLNQINGVSNKKSSSVSSNKISDTGISTASSSATDIKVENTNTSTPSDSNSTSENPILEKYKSVLLDNGEFLSTDNKKQLSLNEFLTNKEIYAADFELTRFTVLDMDGDDIPEVILELSVDDYPEFYEVLHYMNGTVYGYNFSYSGLHALKTDGTFHYSNGASDNGYGKLKFKADGYETEILGYMSSTQKNEGTAISYFINNQQVTKDSYNSFAEEQDNKNDAVWNDFTKMNVEKELSLNP